MRCFCVLGPSQSGKTTLIDRLASLEDEPARSVIGGGLELARFRFGEEDWGAIDCPGSIETLPQTRQALLAADAAIVCVKPDPEAAALAAPFLRLAEASGTPSILFVNRIDEAQARVRDVVAALQDYAQHAIVLRQAPIRTDGEITGAIDLISERAWKYREGQPSTLIEIPDSALEREHEARGGLLEDLSELDDWLLEELVEDREPAAGPLYAIAAKALRENAATPVFLGSASHGNGVRRLMKALRHEAPPLNDLRARLAEGVGAEASALKSVTFNVDHRKHVGKVAVLRALDPAGLSSGSALAGGGLGSLLERNGSNGSAAAGEIVAVAKSEQLKAGEIQDAARAYPGPAWSQSPRPMIARAVSPSREKDEAKLSGVLARLAEDEPGLEVAPEIGTGRLVVRLQGPAHLRHLKARLSDVFGIDIEEHPERDSYRETITKPVETHYRHRKQSGGAGQFADVKLTAAPAPRGTGFQFEETVKGGAVPRNYIPAVEAGARDAMASGPLGFSVLDVQVTLTDGQHHSVDSSDFAFRTAGRFGVAKALAEAAPVLLQPIHRVTIRTPSVYSGGLTPMVASLKGQILGFERDPDAKGWDLFHALMPQHVLADLPTALRAATQGAGWFDDAFDHYEEVYGKEAERIVAQHRDG
ncbi:MAG: elongation factor G [Pseudomonadota bacterium]